MNGGTKTEPARHDALAWLVDGDALAVGREGLVRVAGYTRVGRPAAEVAVMEKAARYGAHSVLFEGEAPGVQGVAQAFVFVSDGSDSDQDFAELHQRLWSWGGVPLVYRRSPGLVQLFRCAHRPDFVRDGKVVYKPFDTLHVATEISATEAWWDADRIRNGTLWDDPVIAGKLLSGDEAAHQSLVAAIKALYARLNESNLLSPGLRRRLLILSLLIAYLDQRGALPDGFFGRFMTGAEALPPILADGEALLEMLKELAVLFNGDVFALADDELSEIAASPDLVHLSRLIEAREDASGQMSFWALYSFRDLPVEVISNIYELFVTDPAVSVYTPPALVRLILDETLSDERIDRIIDDQEVVIDPACGSGIFLVEAYKRIILRWRSRNSWVQPDVPTLRTLLKRVHGVDIEAGAVELATFSLCLAMCDALTPEQIRATPELFPKLRDQGLIQSCFFLANEQNRLSTKIAVVLGNPPFKSRLDTEGAQRAYRRYVKAHGRLPDLQIAYLFLHEGMHLLRAGGVLGMLQQYNLLYNEKPDFRRSFLTRWNVREILDFVSVRGLFSKDTKVLTVVALAEAPSPDGSILHAVFRRTARAEANQRFDVDYYDLHRVPMTTISEDSSPDLWRSNLLGGARTYAFVKRLREMPTLQDHATHQGWDFGEGFIEGQKGKQGKADHLYGRPLLPSDALTTSGVDVSRITVVDKKPIEGPRTAARFTAPMLLIREHADLPHVLWREGGVTYKNKIVGFAAREAKELEPVERWLTSETVGLRAFAATISLRMLNQKATTLSCRDIYDLPFDSRADGLSLSFNEQIVASDIINHYFEFARMGSTSGLARADGRAELDRFARVFADQIGAFYPRKPLKSAGHADFGGTLCAGFVFGEGQIDWSGTEPLKGRLDTLLREHRGTSLSMTRIARIYDGDAIYLLKPARLRYWLRSIALRDSDETLADLRAQGF
ncbi:HsdM family class I SAM-dependent methyltransferase [Sphingomonas sp. LHG3443-2]|uniref:HsdM family class I SAM-dependent methyltransferase n=1 Tax=Sphingomonas sp. LHG3443-2 TaxID=2804639 RepID=UPI003CF19EBA